MNTVKKMVPLLIIFGLIAAIVAIFLSRAEQQKMVTVHEGNLRQLPVDIKPGHYQDSQCGMPIAQLRDSAQVSAPGGKTWFFDDVGCMASWIASKPFMEEARIWVFSRDTQEWIDGRRAWYSLTDETPMRYGFGAYSQQKEGRVDFETMHLKMLRGENLTDPYVRRELLGNR